MTETSETPGAYVRNGAAPGHRLRWNKVPEVTAYFWIIKVLCTTVSETAADFLNSNLGMDLTGVSLTTCTTVFAVALAVVFAIWYRRQGTLSIHSIDTVSREAYYWLAVLFTFALGTSAGDLVAEKMAIGYWVSAILFGLAIAAVAVAHFALGLNAVLSFWIAYILTRPLGASMGD